MVVRVQDTGPGIPPQIRARLFQPFVTAGKNGVGRLASRTRRFSITAANCGLMRHGRACFLIQLPSSAIKAD